MSEGLPTPNWQRTYQVVTVNCPTCGNPVKNADGKAHRKPKDLFGGTKDYGQCTVCGGTGTVTSEVLVDETYNAGPS